jgi:hypothetical protein
MMPVSSATPGGTVVVIHDPPFVAVMRKTIRPSFRQ